MTRFDVHRSQPRDIRAFDMVFAKTDADRHGLVNDMLRYLCIRFDPHNSDIRQSPTVQEKVRLAEELAKFKVPAIESRKSDSGEIVWEGDWALFMSVESMFFEVFGNLEFEFLFSLEIAIAHTNEVLRMPIPSSISPEDKARLMVVIQKGTEANAEALEKRSAIIKRMADGDAAAEEAIASASRVRRHSISPEKNLPKIS